MKKSLLAVELSGEEIRAAVVSKNGRHYEVLDFAALKRGDARDDLPEVDLLKSLADRLGRYGGPAVLVTPMARAFELLMDRRKVGGLKYYQLQEAVKWEVEPYTGISGTSALVGVEPQRKTRARPGEIMPELDDDQVSVTVAAIERNVFRAARERFKAAGFSLIRIYPPEVTFFYPLFLNATDSPQALLEVGQDYSNFAILQGGTPEQINTLSLSLESLSAHLSGEIVSQELVDSLRFTVRQTPEPEPLVISGPGAGDQAVVDFISEFCPNGAKVLDISRKAGVADARDDTSHAVFGMVVGAAVRELRGWRDRQTGISDKLPLIPRLKKSAYLAPLVTTVLILLLLTGHYQFMKFRDNRYKGRIKELKTQLKGRKAELAKYERLISQSSVLEKDIDLAKKRLEYIQGRAHKELEHLISCLRGLAGVLSDQVVLQSVTQQDADSFLVVGSAFNLAALGEYTNRIQEAPWCRAAILDKLGRGTAGKHLEFQLTIKTLREDT